MPTCSNPLIILASEPESDSVINLWHFVAGPEGLSLDHAASMAECKSPGVHLDSTTDAWVVSAWLEGCILWREGL